MIDPDCRSCPTLADVVAHAVPDVEDGGRIAERGGSCSEGASEARWTAQLRHRT